MDSANGVSHAFAELVTRIEKGWFGPRNEDWSDLQRILCAWMGSMTFFGTVILVELKTWAVDFVSDEDLR